MTIYLQCINTYYANQSEETISYQLEDQNHYTQQL